VRGQPPQTYKRRLVRGLKHAYCVTFGEKSRKLNKVLKATGQAYECSRKQPSSHPSDLELPPLPDLYSDLLNVKPPK
jgi:hypothetical protein